MELSCLLILEKMCCASALSADAAVESRRDSLNASTQSKGPSACRPAWKPLLLIVPLRLGINQINPVYVDAFKVSHIFPRAPCRLPIPPPCEHGGP